MNLKLLQAFSKNLFYLFVFLLPWQTIYLIQEKFVQEKWQYASWGIYLFEIVLFFSLFFFFLSCSWTKIKKIILLIFSQKYFWIGLLFFVWLVFSILWSTNKVLSYHYLLLFLILFLVFLFLFYFKNEISFLSISLLFIFSLTLHSLIGEQQFFQQNTWSNKWLGISSHSLDFGGTAKLNVNGIKYLRAYGGFNHPNIFGGFLAISLLLLLVLFFYSQTIKEKIVLLIIFLIQFFSFLATFSRSSWLGFTVGLLILIFLLNKNIHRSLSFIFKKIYPLLLASFFVIFYFISHYYFLFNQRFSLDISQQTSLTQRWDYKKQAWNIFQKHPWKGIGLNNYVIYLYQHQATPSIPIWQWQPVHNIYLLILTEIGIIGVFLLILFFYFIFINFRKKNKPSNISSITTLASLGTLITIGFFDHWIWTQISGFLLTGLILNFLLVELFKK